MLLRFITGRSRFRSEGANDSKIDFNRDDNDDAGCDDRLPTSGTCSYNLYWPEYSSVEVAKQKLLFAISHCVEVDNDGGDDGINFNAFIESDDEWSDYEDED